MSQTRESPGLLCLSLCPEASTAMLSGAVDYWIKEGLRLDKRVSCPTWEKALQGELEAGGISIPGKHQPLHSVFDRHPCRGRRPDSEVPGASHICLLQFCDGSMWHPAAKRTFWVVCSAVAQNTLNRLSCSVLLRDPGRELAGRMEKGEAPSAELGSPIPKPTKAPGRTY